MNAFRTTLTATLVLAGSALAVAQQPADDNFDWRDAAANALQEVDEHIKVTGNLVQFKSNWFGISTKNQVLKSWSDAGNAVRRKAAYINKKYGRSLGWGAFLADAPAKALGHWSVGQFEDGGVVLANEGVKTFATMGGAYVGAGGVLAGMKMMGIGGMTIGGPAAGIVGAAIGGVIGAVGGGIIYDGYVSEYIEQVAHGTVDMGRSALRYFFLLPGEQFPLEEDSRHDFLVRQVIEQHELELRKLYGYEGTDDEEVLLTDKMRDPDKILDKTPPDASKPVIPDPCVITAVMWMPESPEHSKFNAKFRVESGIVTGSGQSVNPRKNKNQQTYSERYWFEGKIVDNRITGKWKYKIHEVAGRDLVTTLNMTGTETSTYVLNLNGSLAGRASNSYSAHVTYQGAPDLPAVPPVDDSGTLDNLSYTGRWQIGSGKSK